MESTGQSKSPARQKKVNCKGCGKSVQLLLSHLERTQKACKDSYDMEALRAQAAQLHKEQMAAQNRSRYHNEPDVSQKKRAASSQYYEEHSPEKKAVMAAYNKEHKGSDRRKGHERK